jgi:thiol-disulfide isomerase/thioredoxin
MNGPSQETPQRRTALGGGARRCGSALLLALAAAVAVPCALRAQEVSLPLGTDAPDATVRDLEGNEVRLLDVVGGKPALLEFWATWCPLCGELQPQLDRIQAEHGDALQIVAVGVAVNQNPRRIRRHLERHDPGYPHLYDAEGEAVRAYRAATTSIVVLLDAEGKVVYTGVGGDQDLVAAVEKLLGV